MFIWDRPRALPFPRRVDLSRPPAGTPGTLTLDPYLLEQRGDSFDITLIIFEGDELTARFSYNTDLFDRATVERLASQFDTLLEGVSLAPEKALVDVPMLSTAPGSNSSPSASPPADGVRPRGLPDALRDAGREDARTPRRSSSPA